MKLLREYSFGQHYFLKDSRGLNWFRVYTCADQYEVAGWGGNPGYWNLIKRLKNFEEARQACQDMAVQCGWKVLTAKQKNLL